jgi:hypothetical protein
MDIRKIIDKHSLEWKDENFEGFKTTEIMYCKIDHIIAVIDGNEEMEEYVNTLLRLQKFIEDLQKTEV